MWTVAQGVCGLGGVGAQPGVGWGDGTVAVGALENLWKLPMGLRETGSSLKGRETHPEFSLLLFC